MAFEHLLSSIQVGPRLLRNRVQITGHTTGYIDDDHLPDERVAPYYAERAKGGAALMALGTTAVHSSSPMPSGVYANFDDRVVSRYRHIADAVHAHDGVILVQLGHMAQRAGGEPRPLWSPSPIAVHNTGRAPHEMTRAEIREVVNAFAAAAGRVVRGGMDGVELALGHGQLVNLFFSPLTNQRADEYGGSAANRLRFGLEVLEAVREVVGPDAILGLRINGEDGIEGGLNQNDWLEIAARLSDTGLAHFLNVSVDFFGSVVPSMHTPRGHLVHFAAETRRAVHIPVFCASRIVDPHHADRIIADGQADMVGMTRAHIADPYLVRKLREGRPEDVRPCVGCLQLCIGELHRRRGIKCVYNPVTGFEAERAELPPVVQHRRMVVVGGGPGGMEAARIGAERGHEVVLFERRPELGGMVPAAASPPGRGELAGITEWLEGQLRRLEVDVRLGVEADAAGILALNPDLVVLATGALPARPAWAGESGRILSTREVVSANVPVSGKVVIVDEEHRGQALVTASLLAAAGCTVTLVSERMAVGEDLEPTTRKDVLASILARGARLVPYHRPRRVQDDALVAADIFTGQELSLPADWVVTTSARPDDRLAAELAGKVEVRLVGDAFAPRRIESAVHEAFLIAARL